MKIEIKKFNSILGVTDVFLNSKLVGVIGISGGFNYLKSAKISVEEDNAITEALKRYVG
jgi:hypothetical protein